VARLQQNVTEISNAGPVSLVTTAETVIATLPGLSTHGPDDKIVLEGLASILAGTATTSVQLRIRRGTTAAGAQVGGTATLVLAAAATGTAGIQVDDTPGEVAGQQYVLTAQQVAATGNGSASGASLQATG
jgi:hypothetical protein